MIYITVTNTSVDFTYTFKFDEEDNLYVVVAGVGEIVVGEIVDIGVIGLYSVCNNIYKRVCKFVIRYIFIVTIIFYLVFQFWKNAKYLFR